MSNVWRIGWLILILTLVLAACSKQADSFGEGQAADGGIVARKLYCVIY